MAGLAPHTLMQRAGLAVARFALAVAPHAKSIWVACGPGNNGGDGLEAALHLKQWGKKVTVTLLAEEGRLPADAAASLQRARAAGVFFSGTPPPEPDLCIDALLGAGAIRSPREVMAQWIELMNAGTGLVMAVDLPSGLNADTGDTTTHCTNADFTLSLLTLKPGLFTAKGRDTSGQTWFDDLGVASTAMQTPPVAWLAGAPAAYSRPHGSHKGSYGDVAIIGGAPGMTGAALLAASAALYGGAGRVFVALLDGGTMSVDANQPELMFRAADRLDFDTTTLVCGCGGGEAIGGLLFKAFNAKAPVVVDADAINFLSTGIQLEALLRSRALRGATTILTPHPLEAARLLGADVSAVQRDRLAAAQMLTQRFACTVVLKGSGTVIASPGQIPVINPTGNAKLATAGTGDVLAGMVGARLARGMSGFEAACEAVYQHGQFADAWPDAVPLTARGLARQQTHDGA